MIMVVKICLIIFLQNFAVFPVIHAQVSGPEYSFMPVQVLRARAIVEGKVFFLPEFLQIFSHYKSWR